VRQVYHYGGYQTYDLTEVKVHYLDGKFIACRPIKWEVKEESEMTTSNGKVMMVKLYEVTEWEEVELQTKDK
jgi:hypothetical protein